MVLTQISQIDSPLVLSYVMLWIANIILLCLVILYLFHRLFIKKEIDTKKEAKMYVYNLITWFIFLLLMCISNICTLSFHYFIVDETLARLIEKIAVILIYVAISIKIMYLEYALNKLKFYRFYLFSIYSVITIIIFLFIDISTYKDFSNIQLAIFLVIWSGLLYSFLPVLYLYLAIKTTGKNRTDALKLSIGIILLSFGLMAQPLNLSFFTGGLELLDALVDATYIISPVLLIISTILIFSSIRVK